MCIVCSNVVAKDSEVMVYKDNVIENFESGKLTNWEVVSGDLYTQPVKSFRKGVNYGEEGEYFIGTTETGGTGRGDYNDKLVGVIRSKPFEVKSNFISFLISGGNDPNNLYIALLREEDGYIIKKETGNESERMVRKYWDVSDYLGKLCYFEIVDNSKDGWGHINVDDIITCDVRVESKEIPLVIAGEFKRIYNPSIGEEKSWYINDHCFIQDKKGLWHLFGITHEDPARAWDEDNFAHATCENLTQFPWEKQPFALSTVEDPWGEVHLWAPHVIYNNGTYYMFYCAGDKDGSKYKLHLATSKDLWTWERHKENPIIVDGFHARDPYILKLGKKWIMYYTATSDPEGGNHVVAYQTSKDLIHWKDRKIAFTDPSIGKGGGPTESPYVVKRGDNYYLFIGPRGGYAGTDVFLSDNPYHWDIENKVGHFEAHAAEVVRDKDGKWYASHCGWGKGGVYLAPLYWNDGVDCIK